MLSNASRRRDDCVRLALSVALAHEHINGVRRDDGNLDGNVAIRKKFQRVCRIRNAPAAFALP